MVFNIHESNIKRLQEKIKRIQNKCIKYGCNLSYEEIGEDFKEIKDENGKNHIERFIVVDVSGTAIINGWQFIASVEHTENGNIIKGVSGIEVQKKYYTSSPYCEHCKSERNRKETYIVMNTETGEFKQVGKGCLADYTHGLSAEVAASYISCFDSIIEYENFEHFGSGNKYFKTFDFLCYAYEVVKHWGYVKSESDDISTKQRAFDYYSFKELGASFPFSLEMKIIDDMSRSNFNAFSEENKQFVTQAMAWIDKQPEENQYIHNLKIACSLTYANYEQTGLLVSLFPAYNRYLEYQTVKAAKEVREKAEAMASEYIGAIGDRIDIKVKSFECITSWDGEYGTTFIYKITDENGNVFVWKSSKYIDEAKSIKGTVKEHKDYRGIKQTEITRCRVAA